MKLPRLPLLLLPLLPLLAGPAVLPAQTPEEPPVKDPGTAGGEDGGDSAASAEEEGTGEEATPALAQYETIEVRDSLPHVPASNTIVSKLPVPRRKTPYSIGVVPLALLEEQHSRVLGDALRNVAGVNVQTGNGVFDFFVLRGLDSVSSGQILTDGAPEPESSFYQLYNVEQVQVLKGPSAFLYGGSPLAGSVNLVRKQPLPTRFLEVESGLGSYDTQELRLDANSPLAGKALSFRLNTLWRQSDGFRDGTESEVLALNPALTWQLGESGRLNASFEILDSEHHSDSGLPVLLDGSLAPAPRTRSYQSPFDLSEQQVARFQLDLETPLADGVTLREKLYWRDFEWDSRATVFNGVFPSASGELEVSRSLLLLDDRQQILGLQSEVLLEVGSGRVRHNLLAGLELARLEDVFTFDVAFLPGIDLLDPVETAGEPLFFLPGQSRSADARNVIVAPYLVDQIAFGEAFQLLLGARLDRLDFEDELTGFRLQEEELSPMLGLLWAPRADLSLYAHAAAAFAPPSTFSLETDRVPEESTQYEVGVKRGFLEGRVEASVALYRLERENIAIPDSSGVSRQVGEQRSEGIEVEVAAEPGERLRLSLAYAYTDAELVELTELIPLGLDPGAFLVQDHSGNEPSFVPEHLLNLWLSRDLGPLDLGLGARYVGDQFIFEDNAFEIDDYVTVDAMLAYRARTWKLQLNLRNLTDEEYLTRGFGRTSVIPAPGFNAFASVQFGI